MGIHCLKPAIYFIFNTNYSIGAIIKLEIENFKFKKNFKEVRSL